MIPTRGESSPRRRFARVILACGIALALACGAAHAQGSSQWSEVRLIRPIPHDRSQLEVERQLLAEARVQAVQDVTGVEVTAVNLRVQTERSAGQEVGGYVENTLRMWSQETAGRIVEEQSPEYLVLDSAGGRWVRIFLRARVERETGTLDAGFQGQVTANQPAYREGDLIRLAVASSRQARAYLFAVQPSGAARLIWPNRYDTLNTVVFGDTLNLPRASSGYVFTAELDRSAPVPQSEMVLAVFIRGPNQVFTPAEAFERAFTLAELNTRVMRVPREARTESWTVYSLEAARSANEPRR